MSKIKAHVILRKSLSVKQDGTPIESVSGFYIWIKVDGAWKMKFASAITLKQDWADIEDAPWPSFGKALMLFCHF